MAIQNARMQQKRGEEFNFDPDKMLPGEWAVSLDTKYVRMCFSPGVCVRMATYEAFEADMVQITAILEEAKTVQEAVEKINLEISDKLNAVIEYSEQTKQYRDEAKQFRDEAETSATNAKSSEDKAKVSETNAKVSAINAKISEENAQRVAESLPEDYTELSKAFYNTAIKQKAVGDNIHVTDSADSKIVEFGLYGKAEQNGEPTPDNPIEIVVSGSDGSVEVVSCGKNLLENTATSQTINGVELVVNEDGSVTANGTPTDYTFLSKRIVLPKGRYTLSGCPKDGSTQTYMQTLRIYKGDSYTTIQDIGNGVSFSVDSEVTRMTLYSPRIMTGYVANNLTFYPMIRLASDTDDTYEPYKETTSTISTTDGLAGIPVESGGNYTDENGQQWICDEVVKYADGSGKNIQRIKKTILNSLGSDWSLQSINSYGIANFLLSIKDAVYISNPPALCNRFERQTTFIANATSEGFLFTNHSFYIRISQDKASTVAELKTWLASNNVEIMYQLAAPIITDLTAEEIAEIEKLHTFYPVTNISNDADCGMSITYLADSKNYIDGQLAIQKAQQEAAMLNMLLLLPEETQAAMIENDTNNLLMESGV